MGRRLIAQIDVLRGEGVAHRDLQLNNVVLDEHETPLFIDFETAIRVDPTWPCYDIDGPSKHMEVPEIHHDIGLHDGVWWDAPWPPHRTFGERSETCPVYLASAFGPSRLYRS